SGNAGRYLNFIDGEPSRNLLRAVQPSLRLELRAALFAAKQHGVAESPFGRTEIHGETPLVKVTVETLPAREVPRFLMVMFDEVKETRPSAGAEDGHVAAGTEGGLDLVVRQMEDELQSTRDQLRSTIEQYETSVEELKASNEELQAINEELRSA